MIRTKPLNSHSYQILLVEEDPKQSELYADLIREVGDCKVDVMSRFENPMSWMGRSNYHLVVMDLATSMDTEGTERLRFLEQIRRMSPLTGTILLTEKASVEEAVTAIRMGAEDYLQKPFSVETFKLAVKRALDRKTILSGNEEAQTFLALLNSCQMISAALEPNKIFEILLGYFSRELRSAYAAIYVIKDSMPARVPVSSTQKQDEENSNRTLHEILDIALHASAPLAKMAEAQENHRFIDRGQLTPGLFIFRFKYAQTPDYFCVCLSPVPPPSMDSFENHLRILRAQIDVTGKNIAQYLGVQNLAYVDDATGLYNTRYLNTILEREITQARASNKSFAVLFMDADKFKSINDKHGHLCGTQLLNELGDHLKRFVRESDTVFRYGGDEFVAVLSPCDLVTAKTVAERIRQSVEQRLFLESENLAVHLTVSIGVALFPDHADSKKAIIDAADQAMYNSKRTTRNSVTIAGAVHGSGSD